MSFVVSVLASPRDRDPWLALAADVEAAGFDGLYVGDHPGLTPDPFVSLAAAAAVTDRIRLGTGVDGARRSVPPGRRSGRPHGGARRSGMSRIRRSRRHLYVDGTVGDVGQGVLLDRKVLAEEGVVVIVTVDVESGALITTPEIVTRGWVYEAEADGLLAECANEVDKAVAEVKDTSDIEAIRRGRHCGRPRQGTRSATACGGWGAAYGTRTGDRGW